MVTRGLVTEANLMIGKVNKALEQLGIVLRGVCLLLSYFALVMRE